VYLVGARGLDAGGVIEGIAEATAAITKVFARVRLAGPAQAAGGHRLRAGGLHQAGVSAGRHAGLGGRGALCRPHRQGHPRCAADALIADLAPPGLRGAAFGLRQSLDTAGAFIGRCWRSG
jgi:hypothetical protein